MKCCWVTTTPTWLSSSLGAWLDRLVVEQRLNVYINGVAIIRLSHINTNSFAMYAAYSVCSHKNSINQKYPLSKYAVKKEVMKTTISESHRWLSKKTEGTDSNVIFTAFLRISEKRQHSGRGFPPLHFTTHSTNFSGFFYKLMKLKEEMVCRKTNCKQVLTDQLRHGGNLYRCDGAGKKIAQFQVHRAISLRFYCRIRLQ